MADVPEMNWPHKHTLVDEVRAVSDMLRSKNWTPPPLIISGAVYGQMIDTAEKRAEAEAIARRLGFNGIEVVE